MPATGVFGPHGADVTGPAAPAPASVSLSDISFGDVLQAINPLQYLPVVGTIYRVVTGDVSHPSLRTGVSAVVGMLTGGPIGLLGSIFGSLAENMFHVEHGLREALAPKATPSPAPSSGPFPRVVTTAEAVPPAGPAGTTPADSLDARAVTGLPPTPVRILAPHQATTAYRAAGLLGAI